MQAAATTTTTRGFSNVPQQSPEALQQQLDLEHAVDMVRAHDPSGYLPGRFLPTQDMSRTYYTVRSFWVETGLRFGTTALVPPNSTPSEHLEWWQEGIDRIYDDNNENDNGNALPQEFNHPTLRLLQTLVPKHNLSKSNFDHVLWSRHKDLETVQYETLDELVQYAENSCASLLALVLESGDLRFDNDDKNDGTTGEITRLVGVCHGLTNALRLSIPVVSTTGRLILPKDLCDRHGVTTPRYLLSALGQGDQEGKTALRAAVRDIVQHARDCVAQARRLHTDSTTEITDTTKKVAAAMLPGIASERFLDRLEQQEFDLTNRNLRNVVAWTDQITLAAQMAYAYQHKTF